MLTCYRTRKRIGAWLDQGLDTETARATATHVAACEGCAREAEELRRLRGLLRRTLTPAQPDWTGFWQGVVRGIEDQKHARPAPAPRRWWQQAWRPRWAVGSALAAALLVTLGLWQSTPTGRGPAAGGRRLPQAKRDEQRRGQRAADGPARPPGLLPPATRRRSRPGMLLILDAPHDALPEACPVGLGRGQRAAQEAAETAQLLRFARATLTRRDMGRGGARRLRVQALVEPGPDALASPVTGQHAGWTARPPLVILTGG